MHTAEKRGGSHKRGGGPIKNSLYLTCYIFCIAVPLVLPRHFSYLLGTI